MAWEQPLASRSRTAANRSPKRTTSGFGTWRARATIRKPRWVLGAVRGVQPAGWRRHPVVPVDPSAGRDAHPANQRLAARGQTSISSALSQLEGQRSLLDQARGPERRACSCKIAFRRTRLSLICASANLEHARIKRGVPFNTDYRLLNTDYFNRT